MRIGMKRLLAAVAAIATLATAAPLLTSSVASAATASPAASVNGTVTLSPTSGTTASTTFNLALNTSSACPGDTATGNYLWQTFMIDASVDLQTINFNSSGPVLTEGGDSGKFAKNLYRTAGTRISNQATDIGSATNGPISGIPTMSFSPASAPDGVYNIGVACTLGGTGVSQLKSYWARKVTISGSGANWVQGSVTGAPTITSVTPGDTTLAINFTAPASPDPAITNYEYSLDGGTNWTTRSPAATTSPINLTGQTNDVAVNVRIRAVNSVGSGTQSNAVSATPNPGQLAFSSLTAVASNTVGGQVDLSWTTPGAASASCTRGTYTLVVSSTTGGAAGTGTTTGISASATTYSVSGLTGGVVYTFALTPEMSPSYCTAGTATQTATPNSNVLVGQTVTVTRPTGALIMTQVCGIYGELASETAQLGFPSGITAATAVTTGGSAPTFLGSADPNFSSYPIVDSPNYPTDCGVALGNAALVSSGTNMGQFFSAAGRLNQITIVDTRDNDPGWTITGAMSDFVSGSNTFSGNNLGWTPVVTSKSDPFTTAGVTYTQSVTAGSAQTQGSASGLAASAKTLASAPAYSSGIGGLGVAKLDARLKVIIPVWAKAGSYSATLTITSI